MKLKTVKVTEFHSIRETDPIEITDITCLVGKNESGKTTFLQALYRLNPILPAENKYDVTDDYPRSDVEDYRYQVESGKREHAIVVKAVFSLDSEISQIEAELGEGVLLKPELTLNRGYENTTYYSLDVDEAKAVNKLLESAQLPTQLKERLSNHRTIDDLFQTVQDDTDAEEYLGNLQKLITPVVENGIITYIYQKYLEENVPKFLYFDEYYMLKGQENIDTLLGRIKRDSLEPHDHPLLGLIKLARIDLKELLNPRRTQELVNKLEGASNHLSKQILQYWSQNKNLLMQFDVRSAQPDDPIGMTEGTNFWARIYDTKRRVTTALGTRSRGFVWFFSFLAWFDQVQRREQPLILLLDEPGLFLHGRAQSDLLRYMEQELRETYQVIYTTHSPFMIDPLHFERVRIVQDKSMDTSGELPPDEDGTKVITDILEATEDSLFPLQGALGYDIYQTLFLGPNSLVVEGVSDLLYIQTISAVLSALNRTSLSESWTITPVGGIEKVPTFVALLGAQRGLKIATLVDFQKKDQQTIENLYKRKLLEKQNVLTFSNFTDTPEADIEDMFGDDFYLQMVNEEFKAQLTTPITISMLKSKSPRIIVRLNEYFQQNALKGEGKFNHYRPARYFANNLNTLEKSIPSEALERFEKVFKELNSLL